MLAGKQLINIAQQALSYMGRNSGGSTKLTDREILEAVKEFHVLSYDVEHEQFCFSSKPVRNAVKAKLGEKA